MPESLWINRVREFGPLIISIDTKGNNLIEQNKKVFNEKEEANPRADSPAGGGIIS
jgi:L(+)-tartrate dehydratase beta subunit